MIKAKRLLTDEEFDDLIKLEDPKKKKKYLDKIQEQLWENLDQKKKLD